MLKPSVQGSALPGLKKWSQSLFPIAQPLGLPQFIGSECFLENWKYETGGVVGGWRGPEVWKGETEGWSAGLGVSF